MVITIFYLFLSCFMYLLCWKYWCNTVDKCDTDEIEYFDINKGRYTPYSFES